MFVFVHIPKTAGTALADMFSYYTMRKVFFDYTGHDKIHYYNTIDPDMLAHKDFIERNFVAIFGHFTLDKYFGIFENTAYLTCFRDPVDRIISHYSHVKDVNTAEDPLTTHLDDEDGLISFASDPIVNRAQIAHIGDRSLNDLDFFFFQDSMAEGLSAFDAKFGTNMSYFKGHKSNESSGRKLSGKDIVRYSVRTKIARLAEEEYEFIASAKARYKQIIHSIW